jgi:hypothetical protein
MPPMYWLVPALALHMVEHLARHSGVQVGSMIPVVLLRLKPWLSQQACLGELAFQLISTHGPRSPLHSSSRS